MIFCILSGIDFNWLMILVSIETRDTLSTRTEFLFKNMLVLLFFDE